MLPSSWWLPLAALLYPAVGQDASCLPYTQFNTLDKNHTMCAYRPSQCVPGKTLLRTCALNCTGKAHVLELHNMYRARVARGQQPPQPHAANMNKLVWDDELATIAQRWAEQCTFAHDRERRVGGFKCAGQNVALESISSSASPFRFEERFCENDFSVAVDAWFREVDLFPPAHVAPFVYNSRTAHYTQMVWADVRRLGCGCTCFFDPEENAYKRLSVCNYAPCGNWVGRKVYESGPPTCDLEDGLSASHEGLCDTQDTDEDIPGCPGTKEVSAVIRWARTSPQPTPSEIPDLAHLPNLRQINVTRHLGKNWTFKSSAMSKLQQGGMFFVSSLSRKLVREGLVMHDEMPLVEEDEEVATVAPQRPSLERIRPSLETVRPSLERIRPSLETLRPSTATVKPGCCRPKSSPMIVPTGVSSLPPWLQGRTFWG